MKRLFIAIKTEPGKNFIESLHQLQSHLSQERIKWVEEQNIHVTLKFLGDTETKKIPLIQSALSEVLNKRQEFTIQLLNLGIFGSRYDPRVVWTGIEPYLEIVSLMQSVHQSLIPVGFEPDRQNLVPHLTLGRIKEIKDKPRFQKIIDQFREISSLPIMINEVFLFESILKKEGPVYIPLKVFPLKASLSLQS